MNKKIPYYSLKVKLVDRIHNSRTMRPIQTRQNKIIKKINEEIRGVSKQEYKSRLFKFDKIRNAFYNNEDLTIFKENQKENLKEHDEIKRILGGKEHGIDHFFNTTNHSFIIKNIYKNLILINQSNYFLNKEENKNSKYASWANELVGY